MTDQQPHTPTTEQVRFAATFPNENFSLKGSDFDRWLATVEAAAEQRGAIKALREAADIKLGNGYYEMLVEDELNTRADLLEGDDG